MSADQSPAVGLKDAESRLRWLAAVVILNVVLSSSYQDALFLTYHRKQAIPPAMLVGSLLTALTTLGLNRLLRKLPAAAALRIILFCLGALTLVAAGWNIVPSSSSTLALFLFTEVATTLGVAATWTYFQAPLEAAQIRWLLPRLGTWAGVGGLLAGTIIPVLLRNLHVKPQFLMWASGLFWLAAGFLVRTDYAARTPAKRRQSSSTQQSNLKNLFTIPLVRWMTLGSAGIIWTGLLLQYESRVSLQQTAWEPQTITLVMCVLLAVSNVGGIATQVLVTTPVLEHFGVGLGLAILPAALWLCLSGYFYSTAYAHLAPQLSVWIIMGALLLDKMLRPNLHRPAESCLVAALSPSVRPSLLLVLGGILQPLTKAIGALLLWAFAATLEHEWITGLALFLSFAVTVLSSRWGALYARTLRETLEEGSVDATMSQDGNEDLMPMIDGPRLKVLLEAIDTGSPRSRELALELLRPHRSNLVQKAMQARVRHHYEPVRIAALRWLAQEPNDALDTHLKQRWEERSISDAERVAILDAAGARGAMLLSEDRERWLSASDPALRSAVIHALLRSSEDSVQQTARRALGAMLESRDSEDAFAALRLIHEHKIDEFLPAVLARLQDDDMVIRREVLNCLSAFADERARKPLWAALSEPTLALVAVRALSVYGEAIIPQVLALLNSSETPPPVRLHLLRILGLIPSLTGQPTLIEHLKSSDRAAQLEALKSLNKLRRVDEQSVMEEAPLNEFLMVELRWGLNMLRARDLLRDRLRPGGLLWRELSAQVDAAQQRVALTLSLLAPKGSVMNIFKTLRSRNSPHKDQARELLRTLFKFGPVSIASLKLLDESTPWSPELFAPPLNVHNGQTPQNAVEWLKMTLDPWVIAALRHDPDCPPITSTFPPIEDPVDVHKDLIKFLKDVPLFEALTNRQLVEIARLAEKMDLPVGTLVFNQGDPPDYLYLVRKGKLRVLINNMEVARLGAGECVGEMAVLAGTRRTGGVETLEACQLLRFAERDFLGLVDAYPELGRAILKSLVHRLAAAGRNKEQKRINTLVGMVWGKDGPAEGGTPPPSARPGREPGALSGANFPRVQLANSGTNFPRVPRPGPPPEAASNRSPSRASPTRPFGDGAASTRSPAQPGHSMSGTVAPISPGSPPPSSSSGPGSASTGHSTGSTPSPGEKKE
ncbi:MAG TPA: cyclic nucleotide-binding domain-containing protein [Pseudomonadota bacterium]|nr:cyclic nucleotide-binding domain-containing protein [Pseudomonadota bacterium]